MEQKIKQLEALQELLPLHQLEEQRLVQKVNLQGKRNDIILVY
jgi:hypothetical protein